MDRLKDLEKILSAARDFGKNLQDDVDKLQAELDKVRADNDKLQAENKTLHSENDKLKADGDGLLEEVEKLENVVKDMRAANSTFGVNLNKLMGQLNQAINDSHEKFMAQINSLMRDEFQKFLSEYMSKVNPDNLKKSDKKSDSADKKDSAEVTTKAVTAQSSTELTVGETEVLPAEKVDEKKSSKMMYADFYAEENVD